MVDFKMENIEKQYIEISKNYKKLGENLVEALKIFLDQEDISYLTVYYRVKDVDSFIEKNDRKDYENPLEEIEDICGIRIVCYYKSDIDKICEIVNREFKVIESQDKEELLNPDQFGYRSHHFIIKIKEDWLCTPNYKGLNNLKAEIQIRTNLMHTWAEIEHKLEYKKEEDIPKQFKRRFSFLSAKLEEADEQFENLKNEIMEYRKEYREKMVGFCENSDVEFLESNVEINLDSLQEFLDYYFPNRIKRSESTSMLVTELNKYKISISALTDMYKKSKEILPELEKEISEKPNKEIFWTQVGVVRFILNLNVEEYSKSRKNPKSINKILDKYKKQLYELK